MGTMKRGFDWVARLAAATVSSKRRKMCVSQAHIGQVSLRIEGAEADRPLSMLHRDRVVAVPGAHDRTETERESRRTGERERPVERGEGGLIVSPANGDDKAGCGESRRIVAAG